MMASQNTLHNIKDKIQMIDKLKEHWGANTHAHFFQTKGASAQTAAITLTKDPNAHVYTDENHF
jgi:pyruvate formate-lyase activating enzyme-like uncharacterized protein